MTIIDTSQVRAFATHLAGVGAATEKEAGAVVHRGANNIVRDMKAQAGKSRTLGSRFASAISYDMTTNSAFGGGSIEAEIGPVKGAPGSLANIGYFGTSRGGGTVEDPQMALEREAPKFEKALVDVLIRTIVR